MQSSESNQGLPSIGKIFPLVTSIAPFKPSLAKNPSYFNLIRSSDHLEEKKKLKEENWKLKQTLHSLNDENLKLKQKLSQKSDPKKSILNEGIQILDHSKYVDSLQSSLKTLNDELKKKKLENIELKKKLYRAKEGKGFSSRNSAGFIEKNDINPNHETQETGTQYSDKFGISPYRNELEFIKALENENLLLKSCVHEYEKKIQEVRLDTKTKELSVSYMPSINIINNKIPASPVKLKLFDEITGISDPDRMLKREDLKKEKSNLLRFFRTLFNKMKSSNIEVSDIISAIKSKNPDDFSLEVFCDLLESFELKLPGNEVQESYQIIYKNSSKDPNEFIKVLESYSEEFDSSKSSDISSGSRSSENIPLMPIDTELQILLDKIAFSLIELGVSKTHFMALCEEKMPEIVNLASLINFFNEFAHFSIKQDEKIMLARTFMDRCEERHRSDLIEFMVLDLYRPEFNGDLKNFNVQDDFGDIIQRKNEILEKMSQIDKNNTGILSWDKIITILRQNKFINKSQTKKFKFYCYSKSHSLKSIPYTLLFSETLQETESPKMKVLIRKKTKF